jgi:hypothetical protein
MGLLETLNFFRELQSGITNENVSEIEYQLLSWGEIFSPFMGDREHSRAARFIFKEYPFKLFSSSTPYEEIPQKLCLTFKSSGETNDHDAAKEFAAFLSLITRRRVFPIRLTSIDGLPIESETYFYRHLPVQERQNLKEIEPKVIYQFLDKLANIQKEISISFVLALRLYHSALELMYSEPEFAYLLLITALEAISSVVYKDYKPENEEQFLNSRYYGWKTVSDALPPNLRPALEELLTKNEHFIFGKILKFVMENTPETFWSEKEDDAKPDYIYSIIESNGKEKIVHSGKKIEEYELIEKENLREVLQNIYSARSKLIHEGKKMPLSIVAGHFRGIPTEALEEIRPRNEEGDKQAKITMPLPPLLTFERLVSYSMVEFLRKV